MTRWGMNISESSSDRKMVRIALLGQKPIADRIFDLFLSTVSLHTGIQIVLVSTNTVPTGWWGSADLFEKARGLSIPVLKNDKQNEVELQKLLQDLAVDVIISIQHPYILSPQTLSVVNGHAYNLHLAPLPRFRGWNSASHAIIEGFESFGVTLHRMSASVDEGDVVELAEFSLSPDSTALSVYRQSVDTGCEVMARFFDQLANFGVASISLAPGSGESRYYARDSLDQLRDVTGLQPDDVTKIWRALYFPPFPPPFIRIGMHRVHLIADPI